jgi:hypothetical protein
MSQRDILDKLNEQQAVDFLESQTTEHLDFVLEKYSHEITPDMWADDIKLGLYLKLREDGVPPVWAAGRACRTFARRVNSDGAFHEHARRRMEGWSSWQKKKFFAMAKQAGISTQGKYHITGIGPADDPAAWVSGPDDILAVAKQRNLTVEGHVNHQGHTMAPQVTPLASDLVDRMCEHEMAMDGAVAERCRKSEVERRRLREIVTEKYGQKRSVLARRTGASV